MTFELAEWLQLLNATVWFCILTLGAINFQLKKSRLATPAVLGEKAERIWAEWYVSIFGVGSWIEWMYASFVNNLDV